jgi:hypothetical protein
MELGDFSPAYFNFAQPWHGSSVRGGEASKGIQKGEMSNNLKIEPE